MAIFLEAFEKVPEKVQFNNGEADLTLNESNILPLWIFRFCQDQQFGGFNATS
jgi:hypothetical protein